MTDAELKKGVIAKIQKARKDGMTIGRLEAACPPGITLHVIYDMLNAGLLPIEIWQEMDDVMSGLGY